MKKALVVSLSVGAVVALQCYGGQSWSGPDDTPIEVGPCTDNQGCAKRQISVFWNWQCGPCLEFYKNCTQCFEPLCNGGFPNTTAGPDEVGNQTAQINLAGSNGTNTTGTNGTGQLLINWAVAMVTFIVANLLL